MTTRPAPRRAALAVLSTVLLVSLAWRLIGHPALSADDAFFLDTGWHWARQGRFAMSLWGNALGHETWLASYPPLVPLVSALNVWAMDVTGTVLTLKFTDLALYLIAAATFWKSLGFLGDAWLRALLTCVVMLDPLVITSFSSLRPEALLLVLVFTLYLATQRLLDGDRRAALLVIVSGALLAMTHWQFAPTVLYIAAVLAAGAWRRRLDARQAIVFVLAVAAAYAVWLAVVFSTPARVDAVRLQLLAAPSAATWWQTVKLFAGTLVAGNLDPGSVASVVLLLASVMLVLEWMRIVERPAGVDSWSAPFTLGLLVVALGPALRLGYVGPRAAPLYLVTAWVLVRRAAGPGLRTMAFVAPAIAALNVAGDVALRYGYLHEAWGSAWMRMSWIWLLAACGVALLVRADRLKVARRAILASGLAVSVVMLARSGGTDSLPMTDANVRAMAGELREIARPGVRILGDASAHYLALRSLQVDTIFDMFPLYYFQPPKARAILDAMRPDIVLITDRASPLKVLQDSPGPGLAELLRREFQTGPSFEVSGMRTTIYVRSR